MMDFLNAHKRRESKKQRSRWICPSTIKIAFLVVRLIDMVVRIVSKFL